MSSLCPRCTVSEGLHDFAAGALLRHLLDWVRLHKADVDEKAQEVLQSESPVQHQAYWDVVRGTPFCLTLLHKYCFDGTSLNGLRLGLGNYLNLNLNYDFGFQ